MASGLPYKQFTLKDLQDPRLTKLNDFVRQIVQQIAPATSETKVVQTTVVSGAAASSSGGSGGGGGGGGGGTGPVGPAGPMGPPGPIGPAGPPVTFTDVALAPGAAGNFTVAHGVGSSPLEVLIRMTSSGAIWFQTPTKWDATNLYLVASDDSVTGEAVCFS